MIIKENINLKEHNTFGIDANASWFAEYQSIEELQEVIRFRAEKSKEIGETCPILHIGQGSNLLFLKDYKGIVLHSALRDIVPVSQTDEKVIIRVGGGVVFDNLIEFCLDKGWYGLENLSLIPGEVGASAVQNIGAYGVEVKDCISSIELVDLTTGKLCTMSRADMNYGYRYSILKSPEMWGRFAVTYVIFELSTTFVPQLSYGGLRNAISSYSETETTFPKTIREVIISMRQGKLPDPKMLGNAGSFFMNPVLPVDVFNQIKANYPDVPSYIVDEDHVKVPAGWLIEQCGWKGRKLGPAGVYEKQALVLVNHGGATGSDIVALSDAVRDDVKSRFGVDIRPEVNFI